MLNVQPIKLEQELKTSFLDYSMSVIVSRALPDVRDGLKPVHRRILFAMHGLNNVHAKPYLKSARVVGDVIGKYHPHSDTAVYDALVRMAQSFSLRNPLIDGQGNFGSIDGDSAAAMRYTEVRMAKLGEALLHDIDKDTVDFIPNYDGKDIEPVVLPSLIPQLLINGSSGIAVGMATNIPPHNLGEVIDALKALLVDENITLQDIMEHIKGPDFPTFGEIHGLGGIHDAYTRGRGSIVLRAKAHVEVHDKTGRESVIITEIPFQVNKARLIEKIADLVRSKKIETISDIRDESKADIRVVIDVKRGENGEILLNNLFKLTQMQTTFGVNMVALVRGLPRLLNLKEVLGHFLDHRREVILRKTTYLLRKAEEKAHILLGLKIAIEHADGVVELIRASGDSQEAQKALCEKFGLSELQAKAILDMRLARLTGLEREKIVQDHEETVSHIVDYKDILQKNERVTKIIEDELDSLKANFATKRQTQIIASDAQNFQALELIADEEVFVTVSNSGYVKKTNLREVSAQKRGGKGKSGMLTQGEDFVKNVFITSNHQSLLCFTNIGRVFNLMVYQIPDAALRSRGKHFANLVKLNKDEMVVSVQPVVQFKEESFIVSVSQKGYVKKTDLMSYSHVRATGIIGLKLDEGDSLVNCVLADKGDDLLIVTAMGKSIRFHEESLRSQGRASRGVTGIRFSDKQDKVVGIERFPSGTQAAILSVCENGFGKQTSLDHYRAQTRGGKGIYTIKVTERNGPVVGICQVNPGDHLMIMTSSGKLTRFNVDEVGMVGRLTQGVRLMNVSDGEKIIAIGKIAKENVVDISDEEDEAN